MANINFRGHSGKIIKMEFIRNGTQLLSGGLDGIVYLWDLASGQRTEILTKEATVNDFAFVQISNAFYVTVKDQQSLIEITRIKRKFKYNHVLSTI